MSLIKHHKSFILSNQPSRSTFVTANGSRFTTQLDSPFQLPNNAVHAEVSLFNASIWYVQHNITSLNNRFKASVGGVPYDFFIEEGLYDLSQYAAQVDQEIINAGGPSNAFTWLENSAAQKVEIQFNIVNSQIDFTVSTTARVILGFDSRLVPLAPSVILGQTEPADNQAAFNTLEYYLIGSSLCHDGINLNNKSTDIIAQVLITEPPGSQIPYTPSQLLTVEANHLLGNSIRDVTMRLLDQNGNEISTEGEIWSALMTIIWYTTPT